MKRIVPSAVSLNVATCSLGCDGKMKKPPVSTPEGAFDVDICTITCVFLGKEQCAPNRSGNVQRAICSSSCDGRMVMLVSTNPTTGAVPHNARCKWTQISCS